MADFPHMHTALMTRSFTTPAWRGPSGTHITPWNCVLRKVSPSNQRSSDFAADFLSRYPSMKTPPGMTDEEQNEELAAAMTASMVAALDLSDSLTLDEDMVLLASKDDPAYQLLLAKVLAGDWHPQRAQELTCLKPY